jgi:hypothetical protein
MNRFRLLLCAVAAAPLLVHAQSDRAPAVVNDPGVRVAPPRYQSAFDGYQRASDAQPSPDKVWVQANRELAGDAAGGKMVDYPAQPAAPADAGKAKDAPAAEPHKGHHMNTKKEP